MQVISNQNMKNGQKRMSDLIDRNLIQLVEQTFNGKVKKYSFPSALQDLWQQDDTIVTWYPSSRFIQRLVCHFDENEATYITLKCLDTTVLSKLCALHLT